MHDFDQERHARGGDRRFKIAGAEFVFKTSVGAEVLARYFDTLDTENEPGYNQRVLAAADEVVVSWLDPSYVEAWQAVRSPDHPDPLTIRDVLGVVNHLTGAIAGRDREQPSGSSSTPDPRGTSSTADSPLPAAAA